MKKSIFTVLVLVIASILIFTGCAKSSEMVYNTFEQINTKNSWSQFEKFTGYGIQETLENWLSWLGEGEMGISDSEISEVAQIVAKDCATGFDIISFDTVTDNDEVKEYEITYGTLNFNDYGAMLLQAQLGLLSGMSYVDSLNELRESYDFTVHWNQASSKPLKVKIVNKYPTYEWCMACAPEIQEFISTVCGYNYISTDYINDTFNNNAGAVMGLTEEDLDAAYDEAMDFLDEDLANLYDSQGW